METETRIPAAPYSPTTHPPIIIDDLQPNSLYLMISVPLPIFLGRMKHTYAATVPTDPSFPHSTYELGVSSGAFPEEFHWDLYWHTSNSPDGGFGVVYRLRNVTTCPPTYEYDRMPVLRVRSHAQLVGLVRVVSVPPAVAPQLTRYLDWMTEESARYAERSYVWAAMAYYRTRAHLGKADGVCDLSFSEFDISRFTAEVLSFAYAEVPRALAGETGERPVIASWMGIAVGFLGEDDVVATREKRDALLERQRDEVGVVTSCWYQ